MDKPFIFFQRFILAIGVCISVIGVNKRDRLGIISLILEASSADVHDTRKTTGIMYNSLLNHPRLKEYWNALTEQGLLVYDNTTHTFKTTEKGLKFLEVFSELDPISREKKEKE